METVAPFPEVIDEIKAAGGDAFTYCYQCGKCDVVCPWNRVTDFSMRKIVLQASLGIPDIELDEIWRCTTCGRCPTECPRGVNQIDVGVAIRRIATAYDVLPAPVSAYRRVGASLASDGNPLGEAREARDAWAEDLSLRTYTEGMEVLFFVGCYYSYDPRLQKVARSIAEILKRAGVDFGILGRMESCCGESIRKTGNEEVFKDLARGNIKTFIDNGVKRILVASPHCYHTFKNEYPEFMVNFEIVHISQFLEELIEAGRLKVPELAESNGDLGPKKITYHDPCYLGRHNGIYDEPRNVLKSLAGVELVEMADNRERSLCCGGGGGRIWAETPKAERFADLRMAQAKDTGAEVLATACPYCVSNFEESRLGLDEDDPFQVKDISELVLEAIQAGEATS